MNHLTNYQLPVTNNLGAKLAPTCLWAAERIKPRLEHLKTEYYLIFSAEFWLKCKAFVFPYTGVVQLYIED